VLMWFLYLFSSEPIIHHGGTEYTEDTEAGTLANGQQASLVSEANQSVLRALRLSVV